MGRKHKHEEHVNHERWVISFADMMTLLFALFVVLYAIGLDKLDQVAESIAFALHYEGEGRTQEPGVFDSGTPGGDLIDGITLLNAQSGPMKEFLEDTLPREFEERTGTSLDVISGADHVAFKAPLSAYYARGSHTLKPDRADLLKRIVDTSTAFAPYVRVIIEAPYEADGVDARNGTRYRTNRLCGLRLIRLYDWMLWLEKIEPDEVKIEFSYMRPTPAAPGGGGSAAEPGGEWEDRATLSLVFTAKPHRR